MMSDAVDSVGDSLSQFESITPHTALILFLVVFLGAQVLLRVDFAPSEIGQHEAATAAQRTKVDAGNDASETIASERCVEDGRASTVPYVASAAPIHTPTEDGAADQPHMDDEDFVVVSNSDLVGHGSQIPPAVSSSSLGLRQRAVPNRSTLAGSEGGGTVKGQDAVSNADGGTEQSGGLASSSSAAASPGSPTNAGDRPVIDQAQQDVLTTQTETSDDVATNTITTTTTVTNNWRCACQGGFLPPGMFGGAEAVFRLGSGECFHKKAV